MYVTVNSIKRHLNMPEDYTGDDLYLAELEEAAELAIEHRINQPLSGLAAGGNLPADLELCAKFLVATWYANRETVAYGQPFKVPITYEYCLQPYINYSKSTPNA